MYKNGKTIINGNEFQYKIFNIEELILFFNQNEILKKSYINLLQNYKSHYDLKQLERESKESKIKKTYYFIIHIKNTLFLIYALYFMIEVFLVI